MKQPLINLPPHYLPSLILAGAPKCGTSSLYRWLVDHPEVSGADDKEPFYLLDRDSPFRRPESNLHDHGMAGYADYFRRADPNSRYIVDGTTHTLYQRCALDAFTQLPQPPQVVVALRRPADRVLSSFRFTQHNLARFSRPTGFAEFRGHVEADDQATLRRLVPFERSRHVLLHDVAYSRYVEWLQPWKEALGERLHLVLLEDLQQRPRSVMQQLAADLDLPTAFYDDYSLPHNNATVRPRLRHLHRLVRGLRRWVPKVPFTQAAYRRYLSLQRRPQDPLSPQDRAAIDRLDAEFVPFNRRLSDLFDLDLSCWDQPSHG